MVPYDATVKCIALPFTFFRKQKKAGHLNSWGTEVQWKTCYMRSAVVLFTKTVHEFFRSLSRRSFVRSLCISLRIQPPISYKSTPFTAKVLKKYRWELTREQRGCGSLNFLPPADTGAFLVVASLHPLLGSFSNDDGDGNQDVKKAIGLLRKTTTLHVHHAFLFISLPSLHDYDVKVPNCKFYGGRKQATTNLFFSL